MSLVKARPTATHDFYGPVHKGLRFAQSQMLVRLGACDGRDTKVLTQLIAVGATIAYAVVATFVIVKLVDVILGIRISARDEEMGIDLAIHGEVAYQA